MRGNPVSPLSLLYLLPIAFLALFFCFPLWAILRLSFAEGVSGAVEALADGYYLRVLGFTLWQATLSTALTLGLGLPGAYVFARYDFPGKGRLRALAGVPFVMPTVVVAAAFGALLGPQGVLVQALAVLGGEELRLPRLTGGLGLVLLAHVFYNYTVVLRLVGGFWAGLDPRLAEAAAMLGAPRGRVAHEAGPGVEAQPSADSGALGEDPDDALGVTDPEPDGPLLREDLAIVVARRPNPGPLPDARLALEWRDEGHLARLDDPGHPDLTRREARDARRRRVADGHRGPVAAEAAPQQEQPSGHAEQAQREQGGEGVHQAASTRTVVRLSGRA